MKIVFAAAVAALLLLGPGRADAGPYGDELSKCLVSSTTAQDKTLLVKWVFSALSRHGDVAAFVDMPAGTREAVDKDTAALYMRLMTESCRTQMRDAFRYEGAAAISVAFELLGSVAMKGIFEDPEVQAAMTGLLAHFDQSKLEAVLQEQEE